MSATTLSSYRATLIGLTDRHIETVSRDLHASPLLRGVAKTLWFFWQKKTIKIFAKAAADNIDQAIWFDGVAKSYWQESMDMRESNKDLLPKLEHIKASVMQGRSSLLRIEARARKMNSHEMAEAAKAAAGAAATLFEAVENFRWTLLELEANHSPRTAGYLATTPEEMDAMFERLRQEA